MLLLVVAIASCPQDPVAATRLIFDHTDTNRDGLVDFAEASRLQLHTNPSLPLSWRDWETLLRATGSEGRMAYPAFAATYLHPPLARAIGSDPLRDAATLTRRFAAAASRRARR